MRKSIFAAVVLSLFAPCLATDAVAAGDTAVGRTETTPDEIKRFCGNIADPVRDRRYDLKRAELEELRKDIDQRIADLEAKSTEIENWIKLREEFSSKAEASLVGIYNNMRPDAAAARMEKLGPELAAALLLKLPQKSAGVILNEMDEARAALITNVMVAAAKQKEK